MDENVKYLFVTIPNNSGSTMVYRWLGKKSSQTAWLKEEGQSFFRKKSGPVAFHYKVQGIWTEKPDIFTNQELYKWNKIKEEWNKRWRKNNLTAKVLVEKSPPNVLRAQLLQETFPNSYFLLGMRNPYATVKSITEKLNRISTERATEHWINCAYKQLDNLDKLEKCCLTTYEELCDNFDIARQKVVNLMPELSDLRSPNRWENQNSKRIDSLTQSDFQTITSLLRPHEEIIAKFGCTLI